MEAAAYIKSQASNGWFGWLGCGTPVALIIRLYYLSYCLQACNLFLKESSHEMSSTESS